MIYKSFSKSLLLPIIGTLCFLNIFNINDAKATHLVGGNITYTLVSGNTYKVRLALYKDCCAGCAALLANQSVNITSASCALSLPALNVTQVGAPTSIIPSCSSVISTCSGGSFYGVSEYIYEGNVVLPTQCTDWVFSFALANRNDATITNISPAAVPMYVQATLNNTLAGGNNSPFFTNAPAAMIYTNQTYCFNHGAVDLDGDSLVYSLYTPLIDASSTVNYIPPFSASQPLTSVPPVAFDALTGDMCMTPTMNEVTVMGVLVQEYRLGILIGSVMRDIQISTTPGSDNYPTDNGINGTNIYTATICEGSPYTFTTNTSDADFVDNVTISSNAAVAIPGSTFNSSGGSRPNGTFSWTPPIGSSRTLPYYFTVKVRDDACNVNGQTIKSFGLTVIDLEADFNSSAPSCVGQNVNFYSNFVDTTYDYLWNFGQDAIATYTQSIDPNPAGIVYTTFGAKTVVLTITNPVTGCVATKSNVITINPTPVSSFSSTAPVCAGSAVNFTNTGSTGAGTTYSWDLGSGSSPSTSTSQNPAGVMYSTPGTKTITLNTSNQFGCTTSSTQTVTISATPAAGFTSTAPKCTGTAVDFTNTGTSSDVTWAWDFGSGATPASSTSQNPLGVTYSTPGTKSISLIITNTVTACTATSIQTININQLPVSSFTSTAPQCAGSPVSFTSTGSTGGGWTHSWDFGSSAVPQTSSAENPSAIVYSTAGTKNITLTISDGSCSTTSTSTITINTTPVASFTSTAPQCTGDSVAFTNTGTSGVGYSWDFGAGATPASSIAENPSGIIYSTGGIKTVKLVTTSGGCLDSSIQTININLTPIATFTTTAPQCVGSGVNFTSTGSTAGNQTYLWDFGSGAVPQTSAAENPAGVTYTGGGTKIITFTISEGNCSATTTSTITITPLPFADAGKDTVICAYAKVQIGSAAVAGTTYLWFPSSTLDTATVANPVASPLAPLTTYIVTVTNTATGCVNTDVINITMKALLVADAGEDVQICGTGSAQIGSGSIGGQTYSWSPSTGLSNTTSANPVASPSANTTYTLSVMGGGCGPETDEVTVTVNPLPTAGAGTDVTITVGSTVQLSATGGIQYSWAPPDGLNNTGIYNPMANPAVTTTYIVTVINIYGCVNTDTTTVYVIDATFWLPTAFTPNGDDYNDVLYAHGNDIDNFEFGIYTRWGEEIFHTRDITIGWDGKRQIGGEELPEGAYVYYVKGILSNNEVIDKSGLLNLVR